MRRVVKFSQSRGLRAPGGFGQGAGAREGHVFDLGRAGQVFAPDLELGAEHMLGLFGGQLGRDGVVRVDLAERHTAADGQRFGALSSAW